MAKAKPSARAAAPAPMTGDPGMDDDEDEDTGAAGGDDQGGDDEGDDDQGEVLLTVMKEEDGTYRLIEGDEDDEGEEGGEGGQGEESEGKTYDSKGALLKGILDILNEDEESEGGEGSSEDQFAAGFNENSPAKPAPAMPQKY